MKVKIFLLFISAGILFTNCKSATPMNSSNAKKGSIKVTILYPNSDGKTFDMDYYANKHMPMVADLLGEAMQGFEIDKGVSGRTTEEPLPYLAIGYLYFDQLSDYQDNFGPVAGKILSDIPNYTNIQPVVQISEVVR